MRVAADSQLLEVEPGASTSFVVEVVNTDDVIDGISARVIGIPDDCVSASPAMLPLFPDAVGKLTLGLTVPTSHPAGRHPLTVQVLSHATEGAPSYIDVDLDVAARPGMRLDPRPRIARARRSARFVVSIANFGNVALDVTMTAYDPDRQVEVVFNPSRVRAEPGSVVPVIAVLRGPRMITGAEVERPVVIEATGVARTAAGRVVTRPFAVAGEDGRRTGIIARFPVKRRPRPGPRPGPRPEPRPRPLDEPLAEGQPPGPAEDEQETINVAQTTVTLRQRPVLSRGLLTTLILLSIIAGWAAIFLLGLGKVFASDPMTKAAPASFFASLNQPAGSGRSGAAASGGGGGAAFGAGGAAAAPAGALSKSGQLPPGLGGTITGSVIAVNDQQPVGRILVQAYRSGRGGLKQMSSAASQADGTYALAGLFPTQYFVKFSASGYRTVWFPRSPSPRGAEPVAAVAQATTTGIDTAVVGHPASMSGRVDPGDTLSPVVTTVTARPLLGSETGQALAVVRTGSSGQYTLPRLPAPGSYQLTFTTRGYQASTLVDSVGGGDRRLEPTTVLGASTGQISGVVSAGGGPLGGARVSTTVAGSQVSVMTPTTGQVGAYVLGNLPTPATYVVTISEAGSGSTTRIIDLRAGQTRAALDVTLSGGVGSVSGRVVGPRGRGLGGATVTVGGAVSSGGGGPTATTLTSGNPGSFALNGLPAGGSVTLTVTLAGYASASVPVLLGGSGPPPNVTIRLSSRLGGLGGRVVGPDGPVAGVTVTATDGVATRSAISNSSDGRYLLGLLHPGTYSVTVAAPGLPQRTALVRISSGGTTVQDFSVGG